MQLDSDTDTIVAVASPPGAGLRAVLRVSGPRAGEIVRATFQPEGLDCASFLAARSVGTGRFRDGTGDQPALCLWMPAPASYTCEDVAEFHLVGAEPLVSCALGHLSSLGARMARAGEFTRRAFLNGRFDLAQAEGVLELIEASNEGERRAAHLLLSGGLSERVTGLRDELEDLRALCEASLDFDESDTADVPMDELLERCEAVDLSLERALSWEVARQPPSSLPRVFLYGRPNAGKSSLFNALIGESQALVSPVAGTTRDSLTALCTFGQETFVLQDAPGFDAFAGEADRKAQELARREKGAADLLLWVVDAESAASRPGWQEEAPSGPWILVWNKVDRVPGSRAEIEGVQVSTCLAGGARQGLGDLREALASALGDRGTPRGESSTAGGLSRELFLRHREGLGRALTELRKVRGELRGGVPLDFVAEGLRQATGALDAITGRTTPETLLDRIFSRFCIGK